MVGTALQIVDEEGVEALSMRTLAQRLESGTATLYRHFASRGEVVSYVVDRVFGEIDCSTEDLATMGWQQACESFARATFEVLRSHPNVAPLLVDQLPLGPNALAQREALLAVLLDNGFTPRHAARSYATVARYVLGFAIQLSGRGLDDRHASTLFRALDPQLFPATRAVADYLPVPIDEEFAVGLELIISGLAKYAAVQGDTAAKSRPRDGRPRRTR
ncbi:TetR/AcrR family transcriptional regulator [Mycobacterium sp. E2327]|uniref:TetR/AcrR family transcriptional regulator n=1 Tax=Mycobacterium sp. E2327 TaxID=1834132 RepID=UPI001E432E7E|nr:TetR/AcrR family transcriptional regulator C-terminal domain-containing protein [Mycobacterium sp. E2327]